MAQSTNHSTIVKETHKTPLASRTNYPLLARHSLRSTADALRDVGHIASDAQSSGHSGEKNLLLSTINLASKLCKDARFKKQTGVQREGRDGCNLRAALGIPREVLGDAPRRPREEPKGGATQRLRRLGEKGGKRIRRHGGTPRRDGVRVCVTTSSATVTGGGPLVTQPLLHASCAHPAPRSPPRRVLRAWAYRPSSSWSCSASSASPSASCFGDGCQVHDCSPPRAGGWAGTHRAPVEAARRGRAGGLYWPWERRRLPLDHAGL